MSNVYIMLFAHTLVLVVFAQFPDNGGGGEIMEVFRLPCNTRPESYDLLIVPNLNGTESTFGGMAKIILLANERTNFITLNVKDLSITEVTVEDIEETAPSNRIVRGFYYVERNQQLEIYLEGFLELERRYQATIEYTGQITIEFSGFFLSSYPEGGTVKWSAATRLINTFARKVFPCYDEPHLKASFNVSIIKPKAYIALSNMPIMEVEDLVNGDESQEIVRFEPTPVMSTYVVGFFVGQYVSSENYWGTTIYTHGDYVKQTNYIGNEVPNLLQAMVDYTGVPILLQKLDLVDVQTVVYEGIQNYGLQFFPEIYLFFNDDSTTKSKTDAMLIHQQRLTYYWFGNLVTIAWWNHLWMQIGLERYFKYFALGIAKPDWPVEEWFFSEIQLCTFLTDTFDSGPMAVTVKTPEDVYDVNTSATTLFKAATVFRMLRYIVSEKLFQLSLQHFLETFKYSVAVPDDLYSCFDKVLVDNKFEIGNGLTVKEFMSNWTLQEGYPLLSITRDNEANTFIITQTKFPDSSDDEFPAWLVGLTFTTQKNKNFNCSKPTYWTDKSSKTTTIPAPEDPGWYIFNIQAAGLYRVNYDLDNWKALVRQMNEDVNVIPVLNRAALLTDAFGLAEEGFISYSFPLCLCAYLKNEEKLLPWYVARNLFDIMLNGIARDQKAYEKLKTYAAELFGVIQKKLEDLAIKGSTDVDALKARDDLGSWVCELGNENCEENALSWFNKWQGGQKIPPDVKEAALCVGLKEFDDQETFDRVFELFITSTSTSEKVAAAKALGCSSNAILLSTCMQKLIFERPEITMKFSELKPFIESVARRDQIGFNVLLDFLIENLNKILTEVTDGEVLVVNMYDNLSFFAVNDEQIDKMEKLKDDPSIPPSVQNHFSSSFIQITENLDWFKMHFEEVNEWNVESCTQYV